MQYSALFRPFRALCCGGQGVKNHNSLENQPLIENQNPVSAACSDISLQKIVETYPELKQTISAWPELSENTRKQILQIVGMQLFERQNSVAVVSFCAKITVLVFIMLFVLKFLSEKWLWTASSTGFWCCRSCQHSL